MKRQVGVVMLLIPVVALLLIAQAAAADDHAYTGNKNCKKCHLKEYKSWEATKMAQAFENLRPGVAADAKTAAGLDPQKDYTTDAKCLACHTVGYGKPGGFVDEASTPDHVGVGCETCHGPGGTYTQDQYMSLKNKEYKKADVMAVGLVDPGEAQCVACHNDKSPFFKGFDYATHKDQGLHENFALKYPH